MRSDGSRYYIAVDGGGSKTEFCLHNLSDKSEKFFLSDSSNYKNSGTDAKKTLIDDGIARIFRTMKIVPKQIAGMVMGLSGCDSREDHDYFMNIAALSAIDRENIYIGNDCEIAFYSQGTPPGLSIVAGTGSIAVGVTSDHVISRSGGWGGLISDEGSGAWIGTSVTKDLIKYCDGYGEYRHVFDVIREHLKEADFSAMPARFSQYNLKELAGFAKIILDEAAQGDEYCLNLIFIAAERLAEIAYSVYRKLDFSLEKSVDLVMAGSLFRSMIFREAFKDNFNTMSTQRNICFKSSESDPISGGIMLAYSLFG